MKKIRVRCVNSQRLTAWWYRADSAAADLKATLRRSNMCANIKFRILVYALVCKWQSLNLRGMCVASKKHTRSKWIRRRQIRSFILCPVSRKKLRIKNMAPRCGSAHTAAKSREEPLREKHTVRN